MLFPVSPMFLSTRSAIRYVSELTISLAKKKEKIVSFVREQVSQAGARGVVVGVSGGVDSALTLALCVEALGAARVAAHLMPDSRVTPEEDTADALELVNRLKVSHTLTDIAGIHSAFMRSLPEDKLAEGNLRARIRMCFLYYAANHTGSLVAGTGDKSELEMSYFTKYGDGAADILPIGGLFKTEVRAMARMMGISPKIVGKPSSPRLWAGQTAKEELGVDYETIDRVLGILQDSGKPDCSAIAKRLDLDLLTVESIVNRVVGHRHKREMPRVCAFSDSDNSGKTYFS